MTIRQDDQYGAGEKRIEKRKERSDTTNPQFKIQNLKLPLLEV
jgi:hypothetical protein